VACHTTGFEYNSGWKSPTATAYLKGNQCENCHGPASKHLADPLDKKVRAAMHLTAKMADKNRLCLHCHDDDNSPHFNFVKYWDEIEHRGKSQGGREGREVIPLPRTREIPPSFPRGAWDRGKSQGGREGREAMTSTSSSGHRKGLPR
jgi:hypothetical protein